MMPGEKVVLSLVAVVVIISSFTYYHFIGFDSRQLQSPTPPAFVAQVPENWPQHYAARERSIQEHLEKHEDDLYGFSKFAVSQTDGIPYLILNLLPRLAPEFWGDRENFLSVMGLYLDPMEANYPMPLGIGISGNARDDPLGSIDYASFTCGGCHIGRVRLTDGSMHYLFGGINSEFDVIGYRLRIVKTLNKLYAGEKDNNKRQSLVLNAILETLAAAQKESPNYFYKEYYYQDKRFDADYEQAQIALFRKDAAQYVNAFIKQQENAYKGWEIVSDRLYGNIAERTKLGFAGMEDAFGFNGVHTYLGLKEKWYTAPFAELPFPGHPAITDIMAVWDQKTRDPLGWNDNEDMLINGGGQWNGHIPMLFYKNFAAQVTLGFTNNDPRVSAHSERLLMDLPAPAYPFAVNVELAKQGQMLFAEHCADCHQPNNGRVYSSQVISTHQGRAKVAATVLTLGSQLSFSGACNPDTVVELSGETVKPCAEYKGVSLKGKRNQLMTRPSQHDGYNALPLVGIWAQAPYLHTGGVPTLYHLLVPGERPDTFIKSRLDYDPEKVGFSWDPAVEGISGEGYEFKPGSSPIIGNQGHDRNVELDGKQYRLDWTNDPEGLKALLEYLKTL